MAGTSEQHPLSNGLENVLQGLIPGLATMDDPVLPQSGRGQEGVIIEMPFVNADQENSNEPRNPNEAGLGQGGIGVGDDGDRPEGGGAEGHFRAIRPLLERTLPFIIILLVKILYDHRLGALVLIGMGGAFFHFNGKVKEQIAQRDRRSFKSLLVMIVLLPANVALVFYVFAEQQLPKSLIFIKPNFEKLDFWTLLWIIGITDFVIKYITMTTKCWIILLPRCCLSLKRRGRVFLCVESTSQLYRFLTPVPIWMAFLSEDSSAHWLFSYALTFIYIMVKAYMTYSKVRECYATMKNVFKDSLYGSRPSMDQMNNVGEACPICQDSYTNPVELHCKHIFCEECVAMWFDREKTCPMCRAKVSDSPWWRDGSTSIIIQWF
ncbi:RING finger and transmembrane domain-containing protein 2-like [Asterias rubens]|uniref:RING finger and transmembrane domain-containing protein 2-like n=1 Tax=Asterias rubens TaxID=7604 RepID=UPI001455A312|nr:RING finger and transmembrane domain-containing protein 2-like [Asterias rubens]XP_033627384.1 RING finger and transmembrane domain-containing protein 2-like [Asterias rubens]